MLPGCVHHQPAIRKLLPVEPHRDTGCASGLVVNAPSCFPSGRRGSKTHGEPRQRTCWAKGIRETIRSEKSILEGVAGRTPPTATVIELHGGLGACISRHFSRKQDR